MGFPNAGAQAVAGRLRRRSGETIVGVNIGKSRITPLDDAGRDYRASVRRLAPLADYLVLNVSSPNTPQLREMQAVDRLGALVEDVTAELRAIGVALPLLVKLAPDLSDAEIDELADAALAWGLDGIVAVNTTISREGLVCSDAELLARPGGISGAPLAARSLAVLRRLRARTGDRLVLVSVGGIATADDVWERLVAGASLVQVHTGFVYEGPLWPSRINRGLLRRLDASGAASVQELIGSGAPGAPRVAAS
jgi:dihydroorotate dehydrogenase